MPRQGLRTSLVIAAALCVSSLPFVVFSAGAARLSWPQFLFACGSGNAIYAGALTLNDAKFMSDALIGPGLLLPMLLPAGGWLAWRRMRRTKDRGG